RTRQLELAPQQKASLVAFLSRPLIDPRVQAETTPFDRPGLYRESASVPLIGDGELAGSGGQAPELVAIEPPLTGNPEFTVGVYGALGGAPAVPVIAELPPGTPDLPATGSLAR